ncbi:RluA family pseudouridine synthase [Leuconostoc holzapfelii]|uniref:Pseudouridine synthase n=1 Tax=Leuconostoc holzapfelii TaxID=434464 RepID=A0A846ZAZ2_9LACO|nr:RluA family pseudouridine synthase [Leuconostoc holzapfelii]NKZ18957.1 RluA family pseudouridine synthase [Leuconostoc holzapfelii]
MTMWTYHIPVATQRVGQTVKATLNAWLVPQRIRGALRMKQHISVNGHQVPTSYVFQTGDVLTLQFDAADFRTSTSNYQPNGQHTVPIIFENDDIVVVSKPAGMKMHPHAPNETDTLLNYLAADFSARHCMSAGMPARPYMVHRIDRETSGAVIVAKNPVVVPLLNRQMVDKQIQRTYLAWVHGTLTDSAGMMTTPIGVDPLNPRKRRVDGLAAQAAKTHWTKIHTVYQNTLLRLQLDTGRMHQIRVHLASIGHPIVGDSLYGPVAPVTRMMLHAATISVPLPFDGGTRQVSGPLPTDFPRQLKTI